MKHLLLPLPPAPPQQHEACVLAMVESEPASNSSVLSSVLPFLALTTKSHKFNFSKLSSNVVHK